MQRGAYYEKSAVILIAVTVILLLINLIPGGKIAGNDTYYRDLEYLSLYNAGGNSIGVTAKRRRCNFKHQPCYVKTAFAVLFPGCIGLYTDCCIFNYTDYRILSDFKIRKKL